MCKEVKFRGKRKYGYSNNEWVYGYLINAKDRENGEYELSIAKDLYAFGYGECNWEDVIAVIPTTIGESTRVFDINNKEIFEGDVVWYRNANGEGCIEEVKYINGGYFPLYTINDILDSKLEIIADSIIKYKIEKIFSKHHFKYLYNIEDDKHVKITIYYENKESNLELLKEEMKREGFTLTSWDSYDVIRDDIFSVEYTFTLS